MAKQSTVQMIFTAMFMIIAMLAFSTVAQAAQPEDSGLLWLVNRDNPLDEDFRPGDLVEYRGIRLRRPAKEAYLEMVKAMEAEGIPGLCLQSAYRPYCYQRAIFEQRVKELIAKGECHEAAVNTASHSIQRPGSSEHQLGLALDVSMDGILSQAFADTPAGRWIEEHCYKFGFVIRYPRDKTHITNIIFEPWHLRYVGAPHSTIMKEQALTLEEYHYVLTQIPMYMVWNDDSSYYLVYYTDHLPCNVLGQPTDTVETPVMTISSTKPGRNSGYIVSVKKNCPVQSV